MIPSVITRSTLIAAFSLSFSGAFAAEPVRVDFNRQILPILSDACFACHGPDATKRKAGLHFDTKESAFAQLPSGNRAIVPGKSSASAIVERIASTDPEHVMPPPSSQRKLKKEEIDLLKRWIDEGADWRPHWAFVPQKRALPSVKDEKWARNPIDRFILARLEKAGLQPASEADAVTLIRRVTLDLTGLPPTIAEVDAFLKASAANPQTAYEELVDRLLKSPRYGEHRARYWLDAARYADTHGLHYDNYREIWPYRDWVVKAYNDNKPFDRFVIEQLAGDLLPNATLDQQVATGFNRCHVTTNEGGSIEEECYVRNVVDRVDTTGTVFLGLSVGCARCHDHKYDPLTQKDYYALFAYFNSLDGKALDANAAQYPPNVRVAGPEQLKEYELVRQRVEAMKKRIADEVAKIEYDENEEEPDPVQPAPKKADRKTYNQFSMWLKAQRAIKGVGLPRPLLLLVNRADAKYTIEQTKQLRDYFIEHAYSKTRPIFEPLHDQLRPIQKELDALDKALPVSLVFREAPQRTPAYILKRGEYDRKGDPVERATPAFLPRLSEGASKDRLGFAQWLVAPDHPLTARVAVNRLWLQLFGTGIVKTAEDFGAQGEPPSHPELLDWLAVTFRESGWDVKALMKLMVMSAAYRQSAKLTPEKLAKDPANRLLSRGPRFRLDAETLRDQALFVSGLMVEKVGGPGVKPPQPPGLWEAVGYLSSNTRNFVADTGHEKVHRRSLYIFWKRTAPPPSMSVIDAPSREACTVRRDRTNTPLQALLMMNDTQYVECSRVLAERILREAGDTPDARLTTMFRLATSRSPEERELAELRGVFQDTLAKYTKDIEAAKKLIAVGESKADAKWNVSELAAYTMTANLILNLDEVLNK